MRANKEKRLNRREAIYVNTDKITESFDDFKRLADNVLYLNDEGKNKIIQLTSSVSGEAKTTVTCNLGVLLGKCDRKVLVIDLDFRRAGVHQVYNVDGDVGLAEYMLGSASLDKVIKSTEYDNVDVLPRGSVIYNSAIVLISEKFKALINELKDMYDVILLDTSPVLLMSDFIHISKFADATLFLVAYGRTRKAQIREAIKELKKADANVVGTVLTLCEGKWRYYARKRYGKYYYRRRYGNYY